MRIRIRAVHTTTDTKNICLASRNYETRGNLSNAITIASIITFYCHLPPFDYCEEKCDIPSQKACTKTVLTKCKIPKNVTQTLRIYYYQFCIYFFFNSKDFIFESTILCLVNFRYFTFFYSLPALALATHTLLTCSRSVPM